MRFSLEIDFNPDTNEWWFEENETQEYVDNLLWNLANPTSTKAEQQEAQDHIDSIENKVSKQLAKKLGGKKVKITQIDNMEITGEYEIL